MVYYGQFDGLSGQLLRRIGETMWPHACAHPRVCRCMCFVKVCLTCPLATVFSLMLFVVGVLHAAQSIIAIEVWHDHTRLMNLG